MAVSTSATSVRYVGNGSAATVYTIPFHFLSTSHILLAISADGTGEPEVVSPSAYVVTRNAGGNGGTLRTVAAVSSPDEVIIYRETPLTQPAVFQPQGPFPAKTCETALDRIELQTQELNTRVLTLEGEESGVPAGTGSGAAAVTWLNATARASVVPDMVGQLGVEQATQTVWIAQSTTAGDWEEFSRRRSNRLVIGLLADAGSPGVGQTAAAAALAEWEPDAVFFAGDNNYSGAASYNTDWAAFVDYINAGTAYPALGNHDVDEAGWQTRLNTKFPYLPGNRRYYTVTLGNGLVDLFVLNSGRNSVFDLLEVDGNTVGSVQHTWFVAQLAASRARWKIAMFHHPPVTINESGANRIEANMAWPELAQMDLICCGHNHLLELIKYQNVMLATMGAVVNTAATAAGVLQGGEFDDTVLWADDENKGIARIVASEEKLTLEVWNINATDYGTDRRLLHIRDARDFQKAPWFRESFQVLARGTAVTDPEANDIYVHTLPAAVILRGVEVANAAVSMDGTLDWTLQGGVALIGSGVIGNSDLRGVGSVQAPNEILPAGTVITISWAADPGRSGLEVSLTFERLS